MKKNDKNYTKHLFFSLKHAKFALLNLDKMGKAIHYIASIVLFAVIAFASTEVKAEDMQKPQIETEQNAIAVTISGSTLHVKNADHMILEVFSITGERVYVTRIEGQSKSIELDNLNKGCYIIRIGKFTRKVYIS